MIIQLLLILMATPDKHCSHNFSKISGLMIKDNGGKAVLAHPANNLKNRFNLFNEIVTLGIDGVEAFCSYHDISSSDYFYREALKHSLIITCGSDFHGKTKPSVRLGESGCNTGLLEIERQLLKVFDLP